MRRILGFVLVALIGSGLLPARGWTKSGTDTADVLISLERPAGPGLSQEISRLASWSWIGQHVPAAGARVAVSDLPRLEALPGVVGVYPNERLAYSRFEDGTRLVNARRAWSDLHVTGKGVTVAVIDSGIDFTHPDLAPAMKANVKITGLPVAVNSSKSTPSSDTTSGHGTHVAGSVAGRGIASGGAYQGTAPDASLVGIGVGDAGSVNMMAVIEAYDWVLQHRSEYGIRVLNNSFGNTFRPFDSQAPLNLATKTASAAGLTVVFSNGNSGGEMTMNPYAVAPWVIGVGSGGADRGVSHFSSGGIDVDVVGETMPEEAVIEGEPRQPLNMGLYHPAVIAPGEGIVSARSLTTVIPLLAVNRDVTLPPEHVTQYTVQSGTSMAAPEVAGVAALMLEANPRLRPGDVKRILQITARPIDHVSFHRAGYGFLDAPPAVELARRLRGLPIVEVDRVLGEQQSATDARILRRMSHPVRSWVWRHSKIEPAGQILHQIDVPPGTRRVKVVTSGEGAPLVGSPTLVIVVRDSAGTEVARSFPENIGSSASTATDIDLGHRTNLAWGGWSVELTNDPGVPVRETVTMAAIF